jgi:hypothetical protein
MLWRIFPIQCVVHVYRHVTAPPAGCAYPNPRHAGLAKAILDVPQLVKAFFLEAGTRFDIWRVDARESRPKERLDRQSIVEHIATLPCFNAEQELTLYDSAS